MGMGWMRRGGMDYIQSHRIVVGQCFDVELECSELRE